MSDTPLLSIQNVEAAYGAVVALRGVSLTLNTGEITTLLGANGAGKTTLLKTISGVLLPRKGDVLLQGASITHCSPEAVVRSGIVHVPEGREIFPLLSVEENLAMGAYIRSDRQAVQQDLALVYHYFPILQTRSNQAAGLLSGGQQQMLAIGRALMSRPRIMLLDEPSLGLSPRLVKEIMEIVVRLNQEQKVTLLLVEQNAQQALDIADHGWVIEMGRIVMADSAQRLRQSADIQEFYLGKRNVDQSDAPRGERRWKRRKTWR